MSYLVQIKQLSTGIVRVRHEKQPWSGDRHVWISGNRACDCNRALLFAQEDECVQASCGVSAYAIQVIDALGSELYREADFGEPVMALLTDELLHRPVQQAQIDIAIGSHRAAMRTRIGAFARQFLDRFSVQVAQHSAGPDVLVGRHDEG
jgi:hypothetical protein